MRWSNGVIGVVVVVVMMLLSESRGSTNGTELCRICVPGVCLLSLPKRSLGLAGCVVVRRRGTVALLTLVIPPKQVLQDCRDEEQHPA